jgi:adenylate cyclase
MYITIIFFRQLDRLLGPGTLMRYAFGRYHRPRREARIFMFLDMKGSTAIAERLDMDSYYALLNDFFHDIAEPVLATKARIYQYIGDEVVLTWLMADGLQDANCVRVFSGIDAAIEQRKSYYLDRYGLIPEYKAGVYGGEVISAEIGDLKRDLIYNGDVLNTTARIQAECNRLNTRLLIPKALAERLTLPREMTSENVGMVALKGKKQPVELVRIRVSALNDRIVERPASVGS